LIGEKVRRERRWTSAGATAAGELVRSTIDPVASVWIECRLICFPFRSACVCKLRAQLAITVIDSEKA
jgi:hypothetical protein